MSSYTELEILSYRLKKLAEEAEQYLNDLKDEIPDIRLTKQEVNLIMGYKSESEVYNLDLPEDSGGLIRSQELYEWVKKNRRHKQKKVKQNLQTFAR